MNDFTYAGKNSWNDFRLVIEETPTEEGGKKILETFQIPGRTGTLTKDTGAIGNTSRSYAVCFEGRGHITERMRGIRSWLASATGYQRLEDTYDRQIFRLAKVQDLGTFSDIMQAYARGTLTFECDPRRFLVAGETPVTSAGLIDNPGQPSRPRVALTASTSGTCVIGGITLTITGAEASVVLDSESRTIEAGASKLSFSEFPVIPSGVSNISVTGGVSIVSIIPRWWMP